MRKLLIPAVAALVAGTIAAFGGANTFFTNIGDLVFPFAPPGASGGNGSIGDPVIGGMAPLNGALSYTKTPALTGFSYTFGNFQADMLFEPAGTIAAGYVTMAPAPVDGGRACVFSTQTITNLYVNANTGQSINNAVTTLAANGRACYLYSKSNTTWDRSQ